MALEFTDAEFELVLREAQERYKAVGQIRCPYFREAVRFDPPGFEHLRRKSWNRGRSRQDQFMRLKHVAAAPEILRLSNTLQGVWHGHERVRQHKHGRWQESFVPTTFYEFVAVVRERRFKVIVKAPQGQEKAFWSLIPFWRSNDGGGRRLHDGDPALD